MFWDVSPCPEGDEDWARNTGGKASASHPPLPSAGGLQDGGPCRQGSRKGYFRASQDQATCYWGKWGSASTGHQHSVEQCAMRYSLHNCHKPQTNQSLTTHCRCFRASSRLVRAAPRFPPFKRFFSQFT